ncbi:MAG: MarR family transcriptional regulator [Proteobacteria bacterium]|nr:MarR family transcriptional regulator [Pseudomonadota bacterium]
MRENSYTSDLNTDEKVLIAVVRAAEIFKRAHGSVFRKYGLSFPQYNVLRVLEASVKGQNKISDVSRIMLTPVANMTGLVKRLEKGAFITRKSDPRDERVTLLKISAKGTTSLQKIEKEKDEWLERLLKGFSKEERFELLRMVKRLIKNNMMAV